MKFVVCLIVLALAAVARAAPSERDCICLDTNDPVCRGGVTYTNRCRARCSASRGPITSGGCDEVTIHGQGHHHGHNHNGDCVCIDVIAPVCADGNTFQNECEAECSNPHGPITSGACDEVTIHGQGHHNGHNHNSDCVCIAVVAPVCADGNTFQNECEAECFNPHGPITSGACDEVTIHGQGHHNGHNHNSDCVCIDVIAPVCADGQTFNNQCEAECYNPHGPITSGACDEVTIHGQGHHHGHHHHGDCMCADVIIPVCADGQTYQNECIAYCDGITSTEPGACGATIHGADCLCSSDYDPVCGSDGITYSNQCEADCDEVESTTLGACCVCSAGYDPVCGSDGITYSNQCNADCHGVSSTTQGECCLCSTDYTPVCGSDGITYSNQCEADCDGVASTTQGACCVCSADYTPVCGPDGKTYSNQCKADCDGVIGATSGECPSIDVRKRCMCTAVGPAVCGSDGHTYFSSCAANCNGVTSFTPGECGAHIHQAADCICPFVDAPVCGSNGQTYENTCQAACNDIVDTVPGPCDDDIVSIYPYPMRRRNVDGCVCAQISSPVCGTANQQTYYNSCVARCSGVTDFTAGECGEARIHRARSLKKARWQNKIARALNKQ